jgi:Icc-related predicted phosphoesterase
MKIILISDTHNEWDKAFNYTWLRRMSEADVVVLAGDICGANQWDDLCRFCHDNFANTVVIPGNHDYYGFSPAVADAFMVPNALYRPTVHNLNHGPVIILGQRFIGHTMWFRDDPMNFRYQRQLNDFYEIHGFRDWVYDENQRAQATLDQIVSTDIVVTHHLPSYQSVPDEFRHDPTNRFFVCDQDRLIDEHKPRLWLHGHTHTACDYMAGKTRVVCNPLGYPGSQDPRNCGKVIEV